jgi:hypothetical protein
MSELLTPVVSNEPLQLVDISFAPRDGDPAHSGDSILRGALDPG